MKRFQKILHLLGVPLSREKDLLNVWTTQYFDAKYEKWNFLNSFKTVKLSQ